MPLETLNKEHNSYLKPSSCQGCPFYDKGKYYTPDTVVPNSEVYFLAQNPGEQEELGRKLTNRIYNNNKRPKDIYEQVNPAPLLGPTGYLFTTRFLPLTGLQRHQISLGNSLRCRPGSALGLEPNALPSITKTMKLETSRADIIKALKHCHTAHFHPPSSTKLIVTMGRYAMFQMTGIQKEDTEYGQKQGVMESWRGYGVDVEDFQRVSTVNTSFYHPLTTTKRVFFTLHLAALFQGERNRRFWHACLLDFAKIKRILNSQWPASVPQWETLPPSTWPKYSSFDTEYIPDLDGVKNNDKLIRWSLCDNQYNLYCIEEEHTPYSYIPIQPGSTVLAQNWLADYVHFKNITGLDLHQIKPEDLMLADSVLYTGEPHNLNYIASKYGSLNRWKHLSEDDPQAYAAYDAHQPLVMWVNHYIPEFKKDLLSWRLYKNPTIRLIPMIEKAQRQGIPLDPNKVNEALQIYEDRVQSYQEEARELTGDPTFNLGGRTKMIEVLYD